MSRHIIVDQVRMVRTSHGDAPAWHVFNFADVLDIHPLLGFPQRLRQQHPLAFQCEYRKIRREGKTQSILRIVMFAVESVAGLAASRLMDNNPQRA